MALRFLLDEHYRGVLWQAVRRHNARGLYVIDVVRVGDPGDLPLSSKDPDILVWAEREGRVLVTRDRKTMPGHLANHLAAGRHSPGVLAVRRGFSASRVVAELALYAHACDPQAIRDRIEYIP
jgi:hypothetical protein